MTGTVTVLRLEDRHGDGVFTVSAMQDFTSAAVAAGLMTPEQDEWEHFHTAERGCPGPHNDDGLQAALDELDLDYFDHHFGFADEEQAREWFPACMADALQRNGVQLTRWEVPEHLAAFGDRQVVFNRDAAALIERLPVEALYEPSRQFTLPLAA